MKIQLQRFSHLWLLCILSLIYCSRFSQCSATCGTGVRVKEPVCMRLYPKTSENPHPIKNGTRVDPKYCSHLSIPKYEKSRKVCKSKTPCVHSFRWVVGAWPKVRNLNRKILKNFPQQHFLSFFLVKCSSGCGTGYAIRNVTCSNGLIEATNASQCTEPRPTNYKQCENKSHCRWRYGKWKNCTCAGHQKRRITCWDSFKNIAANNCPDSDKPISRQRCNAPPNCN